MRYVLLLLPLLLVAACEDEVTIDPGFETPQPVVDAWITTEPGEQTIRLSQTQSFFTPTNPPGISGAEVRVCVGAAVPKCYPFVDQGDGRYTYAVGFGESLAEVGEQVALFAELPSGKTVTALTQVARPAIIDSLVFNFEEEQLGLDSGYYAQLYAVDPVGIGDFYMVRTTINDTFSNRVNELVLVADAAFSPGTSSDGIPFIFPLRFAVNRSDSDGSTIAVNRGDTFAIEVWSLSPQAFFFLDEARTQITNGESQLFSLPVANVRGNVVDAETGESVIGFFNVAKVVGIGRRFE